MFPNGRLSCVSPTTIYTAWCTSSQASGMRETRYLSLALRNDDLFVSIKSLIAKNFHSLPVIFDTSVNDALKTCFSVDFLPRKRPCHRRLHFFFHQVKFLRFLTIYFVQTSKMMAIKNISRRQFPISSNSPKKKRNETHYLNTYSQIAKIRNSIAAA